MSALYANVDLIWFERSSRILQKMAKSVQHRAINELLVDSDAEQQFNAKNFIRITHKGKGVWKAEQIGFDNHGTPAAMAHNVVVQGPIELAKLVQRWPCWSEH